MEAKNMNEKEIETWRNNKIYFMEKFFGVKLTCWQKRYLKTLIKTQEIKAGFYSVINKL
jgi:hypothetical protein